MFEVNFREISYNLNKIVGRDNENYCKGCYEPLPHSYDIILLRKYSKYGLSREAIDILEEEYQLRDVGVQTYVTIATDPPRPKSKTKI